MHPVRGRGRDRLAAAGLKDEEPLELLDRAYGELVAELTTRDPGAPGGTWYPPDPTVGFWFRRMAQESVIHRIDAELGAGAAIAPVPADLAVDGVDELLKVFVAYSVEYWGDYFTEALANSPGRIYQIETDGHRRHAQAWAGSSGPLPAASPSKAGRERS